MTFLLEDFQQKALVRSTLKQLFGSDRAHIRFDPIEQEWVMRAHKGSADWILKSPDIEQLMSFRYGHWTTHPA